MLWWNSTKDCRWEIHWTSAIIHSKGCLKHSVLSWVSLGALTFCSETPKCTTSLSWLVSYWTILCHQFITRKVSTIPGDAHYYCSQELDQSELWVWAGKVQNITIERPNAHPLQTQDLLRLARSQDLVREVETLTLRPKLLKLWKRANQKIQLVQQVGPRKVLEDIELSDVLLSLDKVLIFRVISYVSPILVPIEKLKNWCKYYYFFTDFSGTAADARETQSSKLTNFVDGHPKLWREDQSTYS